MGEINDFFTLFDFSAKWDIVPTILTQNHTQVIKGFMGQTTAFKNDYIKSNVTVMGQTKSLGSARYIHGELGQGQWTYYGGHDPEDYRHLVGDPHRFSPPSQFTWLSTHLEQHFVSCCEKKKTKNLITSVTFLRQVSPLQRH